MAEASAAHITKLVDAVVSAAKKAEGDDRAEQARAVDGLKALRKLPVETKVLGETRAGKRIRMLTKHPDKQLAAAASETVAAWKHLVRRESLGPGSQQSGASMGVAPASPASAAAAATGVSSPSQQPLASQADAADAPDSRQASAAPQATAGFVATEKLSTIDGGGGGGASSGEPAIPRTGDDVRDKCRANLVRALQQAVAEGAQGVDPVATGVAIEVALHAGNSGVTPAYKAKFRQLHFNMKDEKNPDLRRKVVEGVLLPEDLIRLQPEELASDAKREDNQRIREKKLFDAAPSSAKQATTDQFQCGKCRQRKTTYYQMQTRSADEPMTTFVACLNCNNRWKFC